MTSPSRTLWGASALLATLAACSRGSGDAAPPPAAAAPAKDAAITVSADQREHLRVLPVKRVIYAPTIETTGTVAFDGNLSTQVLAAISGPVVRILVEPGAEVKRGDLLAVVSSPDFSAAVSAFRKAQATAVQAQKVAELNDALYQSDGIARREMEQSKVDALSAAADRDAALQQLRALGLDSATIEALRQDRPVGAVQGAIRAPIDGTVVEKLITPGQLLQAGSTACFTIADLSRVWVFANVFEADLASVAKGDHADISTTAAPDHDFHGTADYVAALVDPATRATSVRIEVRNTERILRRDMYVEVAIQSSRKRPGLLVPVSAVLRDEDNLPFVFVESSPGVFARRRVTVGSRVGDSVDIREGVKEGERVISEGGLYLEFAQNQ